MRHQRVAGAVLPLFFGFLISSPAAETTQAVLTRMDASAAGFHKLTAKFTKVNHIAVLSDTTTESGAVWLMKVGKDIQMCGEITGADARSYGFRDSKGEIYYPKINTVQIYDLGKQKSLIDQFLLLGFGTSSKDIARNYAARVTGDGVVGGRKAAVLELTPKDKKTLEQLVKVELWIPMDAGYPIQQKFWQPGGDYYLVTYSDIQVNPRLPDGDFRLKLPAGVRQEHPQK